MNNNIEYIFKEISNNINTWEVVEIDDNNVTEKLK